MTDWQTIRSNDFRVPEGGDVTRLVAELVDMLASPDPEVRDELGYSALATWIHEGVVPDDQLRPLGDLMVQRFGSDQVQVRTFAPLVLDVMVATRGVCEPAWVDAFERWYAAEGDLRGHDPQLGWLHAVAHGADLLGELGLRPDVPARRMLDLAATRMVAGTPVVWQAQEDDRLAYAVGRVLTRADLSRTDAVGWLDPVADVLAEGRPGPVPAQVSNTLRTLRMLYLVVDRGVRIGPDDVRPVPERDAVLDRVAEVLHPASPWAW